MKPANLEDPRESTKRSRREESTNDGNTLKERRNNLEEKRETDALYSKRKDILPKIVHKIKRK